MKYYLYKMDSDKKYFMFVRMEVLVLKHYVMPLKSMVQPIIYIVEYPQNV